MQPASFTEIAETLIALARQDLRKFLLTHPPRYRVRKLSGWFSHWKKVGWGDDGLVKFEPRFCRSVAKAEIFRDIHNAERVVRDHPGCWIVDTLQEPLT